MRILVVDDNEDLVNVLGDVIEDAGHTVQKCTSGAQALELVRSMNPHVILLDLAMPGIDGLEVSRTLRAERGLAATKIIAVSGLDDADIRKKTAEAGFDLLIRKPVDSDALLDMLETLRLSVHMSESAGTR